MNTAELYCNLSRERSFALLGLGNDQALASAEAKWKQAVAEEMESRTVETEILQRFNMRHLEEALSPQLLVPTNPDEFIKDGFLVDQWNRTRRPL